MPVSFVNPYAGTEGRGFVWMRGNLHAHSTRSDGRRAPQAVVDAYAKLGHDFFALSDHDVLSDYREIDARGMILIRANEVSMRGNHIQHVGASVRVEPLPDRQLVIDAIVADGGFAVVNHPNWQEHFNHCSFEKLLELKNYIGMEIFNGTCQPAPGSAYALDKWDRLLSTGRIVWGFANDDSHYEGCDGLGWNVVRVPAKGAGAAEILAALRAGRFYASTGVEIDVIETEGSVLRIAAKNAEAIEIVGELGRQMAFVEASEIAFDASDVAVTYLRAQCYGKAGRMAWTQPLTVLGGRGERMRKLAEHKPELKALRAEATPPLTGTLDGPLWQQAREGAVFFDSADGSPPAVATCVRCIVSPTHVQFGLRCEEPLMDKLKANCRDGDANMWTDDSIEIFLDVDGKGATYFHIAANTLGHWVGAHSVRDVKPRCECKAVRGAAGWTLQVSIALDSLGATAEAGRRWGLHVCRNRTAAAKHCFWAWVGGSNHNVSSYGYLNF